MSDNQTPQGPEHERSNEALDERLDERAPFLGSWRNIYIAVAITNVVMIAVLFLLGRVYPWAP